MAIRVSERIASDGERLLESEELVRALRPWRRRLLLHRLTRGMARGLVAALLVAGLLLLIARFAPWESALIWAGGLAGLCLLSALVWIIWRRPSLARSARLVDRQLRLQDRLGTAWELRAEGSPLAQLQRRDALRELALHTPGRALKLRPTRATLITLGVLVLVMVLLLVLPNPMTAVLQKQAAFQAKVASQVKAIDRARQTLNQQTNIPPSLKKQIDSILRDTEAKLQNAKSEAEAQQILAQSQAKLDQLRNQLGTNSTQARQAAASSLQNSSNAAARSAGQAMSAGDLRKLQASLQQLATDVSKMSPAERAKLAQQIEQSANQAGQDPKLQASLHQLAKAVADGNASEISDATQAVQAATAESNAAQAQSNAIDQASKSTQQAANNLATSTTDTTPSQGQTPGQGQNPGQNQGQTPGQNPGQGQGQTPGQGQGQNPGQGQGQTPGQGQGQNPGQGNGGKGKGSQNGSNGGGNQTGKNEQVYVPGQTGSGPSTQGQGGTNGVVQQGGSVPYSQVVQQYTQMARDAIDNSNVPPDMKNLVHDYFNTLEGQ